MYHVQAIVDFDTNKLHKQQFVYRNHNEAIKVANRLDQLMGSNTCFVVTIVETDEVVYRTDRPAQS